MFTRKRLIYITIATYYLISGIEIALIFPTLWLYLYRRFDAPEYMVGVVMAAFNLSGFFSSPIIGRWSDVSHRSKWIMIFCDCCEMAGNIIYMIGVYPGVLVLGRSIAGIGTGAGAAMIAAISRATAEGERTPIMARLLACKQLGLLFGPVFSILLKDLDFNIGPIKVDVFSFPGLLMAGLWFLHAIMVFVFVNDLRDLCDVDSPTGISHLIPERKNVGVRPASESNEIKGTADGNHLLPQTSNFTAQSSSTEVLADVMEEEEEEDRCDATDEPMTPLLSPSAPGCPSEDDNKNISSTGLVLTAPRAESESLSDEEDETHGATKRARLSHDQPVPVDGQVCEWRWPTLHETERRDVPSVHNGTAATLCAAAGSGGGGARADGIRTPPSATAAADMDETDAPRLSRSGSYGRRLRKRRRTGDENLTFRRRQYIRQCSIQYSQHYLLMRQLSRQPYTRPTEERTLKERIAFCVTECLREEVVVLLTIQFVTDFTRMTLEAMLTPLTTRLLAWGILENSILYSCTGILLLGSYSLVTYASRLLQDRSIILLGICGLALSMIWQLATVAPAKPLDDGLLAYLIVAMVIGLLGLPPVLVCAVSLLSKLTSLEHQGFRQGVQSSVSNIAQTIGPLWGSALVIHLYWLYPVTLLVILLPVGMMGLSWRRLSDEQNDQFLADGESQYVNDESFLRFVTTGHPPPSMTSHYRSTSAHK